MNVLLISSDQSAVNSLSLAIALRGHEVRRVTDSPSALATLLERPFDLVVIDELAGGDREQVRLCHEIRQIPQARQAAIWVITDRERTDQVVAAIDAGATTFLVRPLDAIQLRSRIEMAEASLIQPAPAADAPPTDAGWIVEHLPDAIAILGDDGRIRFASAQFESVLGYTSDALIGVDCVSLCHPADVSRFLQALTTSIDQLEQVTTVEVRFRHAAGEWQNVDVRFLHLRETPADGGLLLIIRDDTSRRDREQQLERQAFYDPLTSLANRALFMEHLSQALARAERFNRTIAVMYIDLDAFKRINDRYGHLAGDAVLIHVARQIRQSIRANDVAARLSGDEFIVLIEDFTNDAAVHVIARRIQAALQQPLETEGHMIVANASIGIGFSQPGTIDTASILRDADRALYQEKAAGRGVAAEEPETQPAPRQPAPPPTAPPAAAAPAAEPPPAPVEQPAVPRPEPAPQIPPIAPAPLASPSDAAMLEAARRLLAQQHRFDADSSEIIDRFLALEARIEKLLEDEA